MHPGIGKMTPLTHLESALTTKRRVLPEINRNHRAASHLQSTLTERSIRKPFRIRTYKKHRRGYPLLSTRSASYTCSTSSLNERQREIFGFEPPLGESLRPQRHCAILVFVSHGTPRKSRVSPRTPGRLPLQRRRRHRSLCWQSHVLAGPRSFLLPAVPLARSQDRLAGSRDCRPFT